MNHHVPFCELKKRNLSICKLKHCAINIERLVGSFGEEEFFLSLTGIKLLKLTNKKGNI